MSMQIKPGTTTTNPLVIVVINKWDDDFALYRNYINHTQHIVIYVTTSAGRKAIPEDLAAAVYEVPSPYQNEDLLVCCREIEVVFSRIDRIIAMSESDLPKAAYLREELGVSGLGIKQVVLFTDKVAMKREITKVGLRVPHFVECKSISDVIDFAENNVFPLILKPKVGAGSRGVFAALSKTELKQLLRSIDISDYECEEYIPGTVLHVDGMVCGGSIKFIVCSKYINNCLAYKSGIPLGSVFIDDPLINSRIEAFTKRVLETLNLDEGPFHLELIQSEQDELVFLELGARVGGGEIAFLMRDLFDFDLVGAWVALQVTGECHLPDCSATLGGFLLLPEPSDIPCEVISCKSLVDKIPQLYWEMLPNEGYIFCGDGGYENVTGRFRFKGNTSVEIEESIYNVISAFNIKLRNIPHEQVQMVEPPSESSNNSMPCLGLDDGGVVTV